jgi:hypothetical protein
VNCAPVAQLDRASAFEAEGREFESLRARHFNPHNVFNLPSDMLSRMSYPLTAYLSPEELERDFGSRDAEGRFTGPILRFLNGHPCNRPTGGPSSGPPMSLRTRTTFAAA